MTVVAAGVLRKRRRILACRRRADQPHPGKWEFPGGKVEPGETPEQALKRELREELGIEAAVGRQLDRYVYAYPGRSPLELIFFEALSEDEPGSGHFAEIRWVEPDRLAELDFLEGDDRFLGRFRALDEDGS